MKRRVFLKTVGATALVTGAGPAVIIPGRAQPKILKIRTNKGFVAGFDQWFSNFAKTWGEKNNTRVTIDFAPANRILKFADSESEAQKGVDIARILSFALQREEHLIDHRDIIEECEHRYGKSIDAAIKRTYNIKSGKFFAFSPSSLPFVINYRKDLWDNAKRGK